MQSNGQYHTKDCEETNKREVFMSLNRRLGPNVQKDIYEYVNEKHPALRQSRKSRKSRKTRKSLTFRKYRRSRRSRRSRKYRKYRKSR